MIALALRKGVGRLMRKTTFTMRTRILDVRKLMDRCDVACSSSYQINPFAFQLGKPPQSIFFRSKYPLWLLSLSTSHHDALLQTRSPFRLNPTVSPAFASTSPHITISCQISMHFLSTSSSSMFVPAGRPYWCSTAGVAAWCGF